MDNNNYEARVDKIEPNGKHGPFAYATSAKIGPVTFLLKPPVWQEEIWPDEGSIVMLSKITRKVAGWRANYGRFFQPSDGQPTTNNK